MGEVEAVFGIWLVPLFIVIVLMKGWPTLVGYITSLNPAEPVFVVVIMAIASSRPILRLTESWLAKLAALGGSTPGAWWLSILTLGPLLGSFITEPAAMTICALLLRQKFYALKPGKNALLRHPGAFICQYFGGRNTHPFCCPAGGHGGDKMVLGFPVHADQFRLEGGLGNSDRATSSTICDSAQNFRKLNGRRPMKKKSVDRFRCRSRLFTSCSWSGQ